MPLRLRRSPLKPKVRGKGAKGIGVIDEGEGVKGKKMQSIGVIDEVKARTTFYEVAPLWHKEAKKNKTEKKAILLWLSVH